MCGTLQFLSHISSKTLKCSVISFVIFSFIKPLNTWYVKLKSNYLCLMFRDEWLASRFILIVNSQLLLCLTEPQHSCLCLTSHFAGTSSSWNMISLRENVTRREYSNVDLSLPSLTSQQPNGNHFISSNISMRKWWEFWITSNMNWNNYFLRWRW